MNNKPIKQEPVAWIGETLMGRQYINGQKEKLPVGTPLYIHTKELIDDVIWETIIEEMGWVYHNKQYAFDLCIAVLRKASEK